MREFKFTWEGRRYVVATRGTIPGLTALRDRVVRRILGEIEETRTGRRLRSFLADAAGSPAKKNPSVLPARLAMYELSRPTVPVPPPERLTSKPPADGLTWIGVQLLDEESKPYVREPVEVTLPDERQRSSVTDDAGVVTFQGIVSGQCTIRFPMLDPDRKHENRAASAMHVFTRPRPRITGQWGDAEILPFHFKDWPSLTAADKTLTEFDVRTKHVPDGVAASIEVFKHGAKDKKQRVGRYDGKLEIRSNRLMASKVRTVSGRRTETWEVPKWSFFSAHQLYEPWNRLHYEFEVRLEFRGLTASSSLDDDVLDIRVKRLHVFVSDKLADQVEKLGTEKECKAIGAIVQAKPDDHAAHFAAEPIWPLGFPDGSGGFKMTVKQSGAAEEATALRLGQVVLNAYSYYHSAHGGNGIAIGRNQTREEIEALKMRPMVFVGDKYVASKKFFPNPPRYLVFLSSCTLGRPEYPSVEVWPYLDRGSEYVISFCKLVSSSGVTAFATKFYTQWMSYDADPARIVQCFVMAAPAYLKSLGPVINRRGDQPAGTKASGKPST